MRRPPSWHEFSRFPVTAGTIVLAVIASCLYWSGKDVSALMSGPGIRQWELWRLLTCVLLHANVLHLLFNVYWVWTFGTLIEDVYGHDRTFAFFVLIAIGSSAAEYAFLSGGIGLSGVGYGLFGFFWMLSKRRDPRFEDAIDRKTINLFVVWFFLCILTTLTGIMPVANIAHGVGAILGALIGSAITSSGTRRIFLSAGVAAIIVVNIFAAVMARSYINFSHDGSGEANLAYDALMAKNDRQAVVWCREAIRIEPDSANAWYNLGVAYSRLHQQKSASDAFEQARLIDPITYGTQRK